MKFTIITLFEEAMRPYLDTSMMWKAQDKGLLEVDFVNLREFGLGPHKSVDDTPYGGGDGMLLRCEPVFAAVESVLASDPLAKVILPTPAGELWTQKLAREFALSEESREYPFLGPRPSRPSSRGSGAYSRQQPPNALRKEIPGSPHYIVICPHYEGYDERILSIVDYKISLGSYVLTGGELPALIIIDSIVRLLPGVLGGETSAEVESFSEDGVIEFPQYTKPAEFRGMKVPEVLLSGHHGKVDEWRKINSKRAAY